MFTEKEYRILISAINREKDICKEVDCSCVREPYETSLTEICHFIEMKIHDIQYKYNWHNLKENPNDLPLSMKMFGYVLRIMVSELITELDLMGWDGYTLLLKNNGIIKKIM